MSTVSPNSAQPSRPVAHISTHPIGKVLNIGSTRLRFSSRAITVTVVLLLVATAAGIFGMTTGTVEISVLEVFSTLFGQGDGGSVERVVLGIRLPRVLTAIFAGAALGVSGAIFQSISKNALGSPDVIGFTTGAATGAIAQIVLFQGSPLAVSLSAVISGVVTAIVVYLLSVHNGLTGGYRMILTGIGVGAILSALNTLMLVYGNLDNTVAANLWLSGSLANRNWGHALPVMIAVTLLVPLTVWAAQRLTLMEMGDDLAQQLGIRVEKTRLMMVAAAVLLAAVAVGSVGPIAFVALAAPQLVKRLSGSKTIPVIGSAAMGAALLIVADLITAMLPVTINLPIGRMTGMIGGLYLIWLLTRSKQV